MIRKICSSFDLKALMFSQPFFAVNAGDAIRAFGDAVLKGDSGLSLHPEDYQLFELGDYDDVKGIVSGISPVKLLCSAIDFKPVVRVGDVGVKEVVSNGK